MRSLWLAIVVVAGCGDNVRRAEPVGDATNNAELPELGIQPSYYRDVAPILNARCTGCHTDGGVGPFTLASYTDAFAVAESIAAVTTSRVMPPWPADATGTCNTFVEPRWLSGAEIAILAAWHATGAVAGDPADEPLVATSLPTEFTSAVELGSSVAYQVRPGRDEYRCFVVDPGLATDRYITAMAMRLDRADVVHHVQVYAADNDASEQSISARDALDPEPGYECDSVGSGLRYIGVWAAGDLVRRWPAGTGIKLTAGRRLVVQLHYHNHDSQPVADQTRVALELADAVDHVGWIDDAHGLPLYLPPGAPDTTITALDPPSDRPKLIRGARIHMHALGTRGRLELVRGGEVSCVLDIPRWDSQWQLFYRFAQPIAVEAGDQLRISCSYDTTSRSQGVTWGTATDDEMCIGYTFVTE